MQKYRVKYDRSVYFVDKEGTVVLDSRPDARQRVTLDTLGGLTGLSEQILSLESFSGQYQQNGRRVYLNSRYVSELGWYLVVEQADYAATRVILRALLVNVLLCLLITAVVLTLTTCGINAYQRRIDALADQDARKQAELLKKNGQLEEALAEVRTLSGFLPICTSCKKIRDDQGYWKQIELYLHEHSDAEFSHSICPSCARKLYPDLVDEADSEGDTGTLLA